MSGFGSETTTDEVLDGIDLAGKNAFVTGASGGLGAETARALAARGAHVTIACRDLEKGEGVAKGIRESTGNAGVDVVELELSQPASARACGDQWAARGEPLHLLINNAGVMACPLARTPEGWELQIATNHFGHFVLTGALLPALRRGAPARVVNLSSAGHRFSPVVLDDLHFERRDYDKWGSYGQAKTANILFSVGLEKRYAGEGIHGYAVHPGGIMTELGRHLEESDIAELMSRRPAGKPMQWKSVEAGAATSCFAATAPQLEGRGGFYLEDCHESVPRTSEDQEDGVEAYAVDADAAERLWTLTEETLDFRYPS
jgi:NAD(P)-dependent dehydrogenase (short-subunit alcohol dehydrogenase family)